MWFFDRKCFSVTYLNCQLHENCQKTVETVKNMSEHLKNVSKNVKRTKMFLVPVKTRLTAKNVVF